MLFRFYVLLLSIFIFVAMVQIILMLIYFWYQFVFFIVAVNLIGLRFLHKELFISVLNMYGFEIW